MKGDNLKEKKGIAKLPPERFRAIKKTISSISIAATISIVMLVIMELSSGLILKLLPLISGLYNHGFRRVYVDSRVGSPAYTDKGYANTLYEEFHSLKVGYVPYAVWQYKEFHGKYTNIDGRGLRATIPNSTDQPAKEIFFFGGSTIWGTGVNDSHTIPSIVSSHLNRDKPVFKVVNYGQSGYQSTQELIQLIRELQGRQRPDIVVFYDGANDIYASVFSPGLPAYHQGYEQIKNKMEGRGIRSLYFDSKSFELAIYLTNRFNRQTATRDPREDRRIQEAIDGYIANLKLVKLLAQEYGFKFFAFWQPVLLAEKKTLTSYESVERAKMGERLTRIFRKSYEEIRKRNFGGVGVTDLSRTLENEKGDIYLDFAHLAARGNSIIAERIYDQIKGETVLK